MKTAVEVITPERATEMLRQNKRNRNISSKLVEMISDDITNDRWIINGATIKQGANGRLLDGQHRLHAVIKAGKPIETLVVTGLEDDAFLTIDTNCKPRRTHDVLAMSGEINTTALASAVRLVHDITENPSKWKRSSLLVSNGYIHDFVKENPRIRESVKYTMSLLRLRKIAGCAIPSGLHFLFSQKDTLLADKFLHQLNFGTGISEGDPVYILRQRLIDNNASAKKIDRTTLMALWIKAWNAARTGKVIQRLLWNQSAEDFPTII